MIRYALRCDKDHRFDSWFQSGAAFDTLAAQGHLSCAVCGSASVVKDLMSPSVATAPASPPPSAPLSAGPSARPSAPAQPDHLTAPRDQREAALAELRRQVEENSEYVGLSFAAEARAIHDGDAPARPIYGEAHRDDARRLIEDGIPVAPLPFRPTRRSN
jgi:hypothetical protein